MAPVVSWDDYRFFLALQREGSIVKAARRLTIDVSTVRRRLLSIEESLGARLFQRRREGVVLTVAGERLREHALRIEATTLAIERDLGGNDDSLRGAVRLTAGEAFVSRIVAPAIHLFRARCPDIRVELLADNQRVDLARGEADVAIRLVRPTDDALVAKKVATLAFGLYASRAYLARAPRLESDGDLAHHAFVGFDASLERTPETQWLVERGLPLVIRTNSPVAIAAVAAAGGGIAALASVFAAQEPALVRVLPEVALPNRDVWVVNHRDLHRTARVRALREFVSELLRAAIP
jgi:DNA-binding transcriptional LysR family regulator